MLPPGFLFRPSDEDLLVTYLKNKILQRPLPYDIVAEADVYGSHPDDLAWRYPVANRNYEWFFFTCTTRKHPGTRETSRASRRAGLGRWKATKGIKTVLDSKNDAIGSKQSFCYMEQNPQGGETKSIWLMEEFSIRNLGRRGSAGVMRDSNKLDDWVIYKIYWTPKAHKVYAKTEPIGITALEPLAKKRRIEPAYMMVPPGFIFQPTDEELLESFLKEKLLHQPLPCDIIKEADVYGNHPSNLTAQFPMLNKNSEWFFFTWTTRKHPDANDSSRASRVARQGRWKSTQSVKPVLNDERQIIGSKQNFSYMECTPLGKEEKSIWLMEEYSIQNFRRSGRGAPMSIDRNKLDDWVICKIYLRPSAREELSGTKVPTIDDRNLEALEIGNQPSIFPSHGSLISQLAGDTLLQLTEALDREVESYPSMLYCSSLQYPTCDEIGEMVRSYPTISHDISIQYPTCDELYEVVRSCPTTLHHSSLQYSSCDELDDMVQSYPFISYDSSLQYSTCDELDEIVRSCPSTLHDSSLQYLTCTDQLDEMVRSYSSTLHDGSLQYSTCDELNEMIQSCPSTLPDSLRPYPTCDELDEILQTLPIDEILQQVTDDESS